MPLTVIDEQMTTRNVTASFRRRRPGPETDLLNWFLDTCPVKTPEGCRVTAFREPRLESGFPDLVLVIWNIEIARRWKPIRASLSSHDIRLMQHILKSESASFGDLTKLFASKVKKSLEKLEEAEMVRRTGESWEAQPLSGVFAAIHIMAIEAKVKEWAAAIDQASLNTWFASSSYVLVPHIPRNSNILESATIRGIGVWTKRDSLEPHAIPATQKLPLSYASWLFNEWTCQHAWHANKEET